MGDRLYNGLIGWWKMDDNLATSVVLDSHGGYDGTYKAGAAGQNTSTGSNIGRINRALGVDGVNEHVEIADNAVFTPALTPFSISAWIYMHDATNFEIASKGVYNTDGEWQFGFDALDRIFFAAYDESVANCYIGRRYSVASAQNQWIHPVVTYDGGTSSSAVKLYINSLQVDDTLRQSQAGLFVAVENLAHDVWIGRYDANYANGLIDNIMMFNIELSSAEVARLFADGRGVDKYTSFGAKRGIDRSRNRYQ